MADKKDSTRTRMLEEAPAEGTVKKIIKKGLTAASRLADKVGFTQEEEYKGKSKEDMAVKKANGGMARPSQKDIEKAERFVAQGAIRKKKEKETQRAMQNSRPSQKDIEKAERLMASSKLSKDREEAVRNALENPRPTRYDQEKTAEAVGFKKGGMVTARGQGKVMKKRGCKVY